MLQLLRETPPTKIPCPVRAREKSQGVGAAGGNRHDAAAVRLQCMPANVWLEFAVIVNLASCIRVPARENRMIIAIHPERLWQS